MFVTIVNKANFVQSKENYESLGKTRMLPQINRVFPVIPGLMPFIMGSLDET